MRKCFASRLGWLEDVTGSLAAPEVRKTGKSGPYTGNIDRMAKEIPKSINVFHHLPRPFKEPVSSGCLSFELL